MEKRICALARDLFYPKTPPEYFTESLKKYAVFSPGVTPDFEILLEKKWKRVSELFKSVKWGDAERKLVYVFMLLRERARGIKEEMRLLLKKAALGFEVPYYSEVEMRQTKDTLEEEICTITRLIAINGQYYRALKEETPQSLSHKYFLTEIKEKLKMYEKSVEESEYDFLEFYAGMYTVYAWLSRAREINECLANKWEKWRGKDVVRNEIVSDMLYRAYNELTEEYIRTGKVTDKYNEYFICDHAIVEEKVPKFLNRNVIEKIAYVGKYVLFLKNIAVKKGLGNKRRVLNVNTNSYSHDTIDYNDQKSKNFHISTDHNDQKSKNFHNTIIDYNYQKCKTESKFFHNIPYFNKQESNFKKSVYNPINLKIDLSRRSCSNQIDGVIRWVNQRLLTEFFEYYRVSELLDFICNVFFCRRSDFIEKFFEMLKRSRKFTRNNFLMILEDALEASFPGNPFNKNVDIYIRDEENHSGLLETFSLYCKLSYPLSVLLEERFVLKLVYIFKFLWKLKKIDYLSRRIANPFYVNLIYSLMFYVYNEVLGEFKINKMTEDGLAFDVLKSTLDSQIDNIMNKLFINTKEKLIEYLLFHMENTFIVAGKTGVFDDKDIQSALKKFYEYAGQQLENTFLFNLKLFIK